MAGAPYGTGACCPPSAEGVTYLRVGPRKVLRGMMGLDTVFEQLYAMGRRPDEATDAELVGMARKFNYIPDRPAVEADYAATLREAYADFYAQQAGEHEEGPDQREAPENRQREVSTGSSDTSGRHLKSSAETGIDRLFRRLLEHLGVR